MTRCRCRRSPMELLPSPTIRRGCLFIRASDQSGSGSDSWRRRRIFSARAFRRCLQPHARFRSQVDRRADGRRIFEGSARSFGGLQTWPCAGPDAEARCARSLRRGCRAGRIERDLASRHSTGRRNLADLRQLHTGLVSYGGKRTTSPDCSAASRAKA